MTAEQFTEQYIALPPEARHQAEDFLAFLRQKYAPNPARICGVAGKSLLKFAGTIEADDLEKMSAAIEEGCGRIGDEPFIGMKSEAEGLQSSVNIFFQHRPHRVSYNRARMKFGTSVIITLLAVVALAAELAMYMFFGFGAALSGGTNAVSGVATFFVSLMV